MDTSRIRVMFILIAGFLFMQFLFIMKVSEPYPSIKFPGFGKIPQTDGQIQVENYEIFVYSNSKDSTMISAYDLFEGYPKTYVPGIMSTIIEAHKERSINHNNLVDRKTPAEFDEFQLWVNVRLDALNIKSYDRMVIRKLTVVRDLALIESPGKAELSDRVVIPLLSDRLY